MLTMLKIAYLVFLVACASISEWIGCLAIYELVTWNKKTDDFDHNKRKRRDDDGNGKPN